MLVFVLPAICHSDRSRSASDGAVEEPVLSEAEGKLLFLF